MACDSSEHDGHEEDSGHGCKTCRFLWGLDVPAAEPLPLDQLQTNARSYSIDIFKTWIKLNSIAKRFEDVIGRRWAKKTFLQRRTILLEAWPNMPATHRPDFAALRDGCKKHRKNPAKSTVRSAHLFPFINLEDLLKTETLLVYFHARSRNLPCKFAFADCQAAHVEQPTKNEVIDKYYMQLHECKTPQSYGAFQLCGRGGWVGRGRDIGNKKLGFPPYLGIQVLEVQTRILTFLADCCHLILRDYDLFNIHSIPSTPSRAFNSLTMSGGTITALSAEAPYRVPQKLDLRRWLGVVAARREQAEDHIWALREDPSYFSQELDNWSEHSASRILNKNKQTHDCVGTGAFWGNIAYDMILNAYTALILWDAAYLSIRRLCASPYYGKTLDPNQRLHPCLERDFLAFDLLIKYMRTWPLNDLSLGLAASPTLRSGYIRDVHFCLASFNELKIVVSNHRPGEKRLHDLFRALFDPLMHKIHGLTNIVDEIQRTINSKEDRHLVTSWVANRFADLAMIVEIGRQLDMFQPWAVAWRVGAGYASKQDSMQINNVQHGPELSEIEHFKDLLDSQFKLLSVVNSSRMPYPCDKRRTESTTIQMRMSECMLDLFWEVLDESPVNMTGYTLHELLGHHMDEPDRLLQRTPRWVAPKSFSPVNGDSSPSSDNFDDVRSKVKLPLMDVDPNARHVRPTKASIMSVQTPKAKTKTHGLATSQQRERTSPSTTLPPTPDGPTEKHFTVNKRASKVFGLLFHDPDDHHHAGEMLWTEFLYAMSTLNFSFEKLYGSSWQFTPPVEAGVKQQPIQFHDPHPQPKLRFFEAKRIGRRLHKTYGWHGKTFVCK